MLVLQSEGTELQNWEKIKSLKDEKGYLGVLQFDSMKSKEMTNMITKEYYQRIRKILKENQNRAGKTI